MEVEHKIKNCHIKQMQVLVLALTHLHTFVCCFSVETVYDPMDCSTPGFALLHYLPEFAQTQGIELVIPSNHLILCRPLLLLPSIFPSIRVFSNESALHIRWSKYWSFIFSISPSNEYSGLISFRVNWFDLPAVQGTLKIVISSTVQKHQSFNPLPSYVHT